MQMSDKHNMIMTYFLNLQVEKNCWAAPNTTGWQAMDVGKQWPRQLCPPNSVRRTPCFSATCGAFSNAQLLKMKTNNEFPFISLQLHMM